MVIKSNRFIEAYARIVDVPLKLKYQKLLWVMVYLEASFAYRIPRNYLLYASIVMKNPENRNCCINLIYVAINWKIFMQPPANDDDFREERDRRQFFYTAHVPERRSGKDRRCNGCRKIIMGDGKGKNKPARHWFSDRNLTGDFLATSASGPVPSFSESRNDIAS